MFEDALRAGIPIIGVRTDDLVNFTASLQLIAKKKIDMWSGKLPKGVDSKNILFWTTREEHITPEAYKELAHDGFQLIVINAEKKNSLMFDGGDLPTPVSLLHSYLQDFMAEQEIPGVLHILKGMSLKSASEIVMLTMARTGGLLPTEIRRTRMQVGGGVQGLEALDSDGLDFYDWPPALLKWAELNKPYFLNPQTPAILRPRGLLLDGSPGVGKSLGARALAQFFGVPIYRLDIATTLNRFIGESENRLARSLALLDREQPCIVLFDEVEKIFKQSDEGGTTTRMLSQLLWWLNEHRSQVISIMTTNDRMGIPPELYRPGRVDEVIRLEPMLLKPALIFARQVFKHTLKIVPNSHQNKVLDTMINTLGEPTGKVSHAQVTESVIMEIKKRGWFPDE
jgi:hypothetical protein